MLPYSQACECNKTPILEVLTEYLKSGDCILEIGSGTGQHAEYFANSMPDIIWQPSDQSCYLSGLKQRFDALALVNIKPVFELDVCQYDWSQHRYDAVFSANTLHIMSEAAGKLFLSNVSQAIKLGGLLIIYGPFCYDGAYTSDSNQAFDAYLRSEDAEQGIRHFDSVALCLRQGGFSLLQDRSMPSNNQCLIWKKVE